MLFRSTSLLLLTANTVTVSLTCVTICDTIYTFYIPTGKPCIHLAAPFNGFVVHTIIKLLNQTFCPLLVSVGGNSQGGRPYLVDVGVPHLGEEAEGRGRVGVVDGELDPSLQGRERERERERERARERGGGGGGERGEGAGGEGGGGVTPRYQINPTPL